MDYKEKWYLHPLTIGICFAFWFFILPLILGIVLLISYFKQSKQNKKIHNDNLNLIQELGVTRYTELTSKIELIESEFESKKKNLINEIEDLQQNKEVEQKKILSEIEKEKLSIETQLENIKIDMLSKQSDITQLNLEIERLVLENEKLDKQFKTQTNKIGKVKELYKSVDYAIQNFFNYSPTDAMLKLSTQDFDELSAFSPSVILKLHCMDVKELRKAYKENDKLITNLLTQYSSRYTTKANRSIYQLMILALRAELQNILYNLSYQKLDKSIDDVKTFTSKYLQIATDGNQSIAGTMTKFIGEIEYLFINSVKIEYNYYVKKEQAKQEQLAIRQQMREEAEERKLLAEQQKHIEKEEEKYNNEIFKVQTLLSSTTDEDKIEELNKRILELQVQLSDVIIKKDEVLKLQNGKAGNVYIISNLGSFGENIFKIGMTRRINPQDRIDELGSASVPFRFDVHSFIFSDNAVDLERELHNTLNAKRVNKVNFRKEFFYTTVDELEELVTTIDPTAEFNKTMLAEEYNQSISSNELYEAKSLYTLNNEDDYIDEDDNDNE